MAWACGTCTYVNEENHLACLMCTTVRPLASQIAAATGGDGGSASTKGHSGSISPSGANRKQPSSSIQQPKPATSAPANSFAALVSRGGNAAAPSSQPTKPPPSGTLSTKAPNNYTGLVGMQGFPGEVRELKAEEKSIGGFHIVVRHLAGHLTALEAFHALDAECQPFSVKRAHVSYYEEKPGHKAAREVNGPVHNQPHVYARCFAEFYPAKGLPNLLHRLVGKCAEKLKISQHDDDWFSHAFITPYFVRGHKGKDGLEICPYASKLCFRSGCPMAHEPEGWGIIRFDGKRTEDTLSPEVPKQNKKKPAVVIMPENEPPIESKETPIAAKQSLSDADLVLQENIRLMEEARKRKEAEDAKKRAAASASAKETDSSRSTAAERQQQQQAIGTGKRLSCSGCGLDKTENNFAIVGMSDAKNYCKACTEKGVPKVECPRCYLMKFRSEYRGQPICGECVEEERLGGPAIEESERISGRHHIKIDFEKGVILSRNEIIFMLESTIGRIGLLEFVENAENKTPIGCRVSFVNWDYSTMASNVRNLIPPNGVRLHVDDHPQQPRVEQLLQLVPDTLTYHEFALLEASYRAS